MSVDELYNQETLEDDRVLADTLEVSYSARESFAETYDDLSL